jgi:flavodoxin
MSDSLTASIKFQRYDDEYQKKHGYRLPSDPFWVAPPQGSIIPIWHRGAAPNYQPKPMICRHVQDPAKAWKREKPSWPLGATHQSNTVAFFIDPPHYSTRSSGTTLTPQLEDLSALKKLEPASEPLPISDVLPISSSKETPPSSPPPVRSPSPRAYPVLKKQEVLRTPPATPPAVQDVSFFNSEPHSIPSVPVSKPPSTPDVLLSPLLKDARPLSPPTVRSPTPRAYPILTKQEVQRTPPTTPPPVQGVSLPNLELQSIPTVPVSKPPSTPDVLPPSTPKNTTPSSPPALATSPRAYPILKRPELQRTPSATPAVVQDVFFASIESRNAPSGSPTGLDVLTPKPPSLVRKPSVAFTGYNNSVPPKPEAEIKPAATLISSRTSTPDVLSSKQPGLVRKPSVAFTGYNNSVPSKLEAEIKPSATPILNGIRASKPEVPRSPSYSLALDGTSTPAVLTSKQPGLVRKPSVAFAGYNNSVPPKLEAEIKPPATPISNGIRAPKPQIPNSPSYSLALGETLTPAVLTSKQPELVRKPSVVFTGYNNSVPPKLEAEIKPPTTPLSNGIHAPKPQIPSTPSFSLALEETSTPRKVETPSKPSAAVNGQNNSYFTRPTPQPQVPATPTTNGIAKKSETPGMPPVTPSTPQTSVPQAKPSGTPNSIPKPQTPPSTNGRGISLSNNSEIQRKPPTPEVREIPTPKKVEPQSKPLVAPVVQNAPGLKKAEPLTQQRPKASPVAKQSGGKGTPTSVAVYYCSAGTIAEKCAIKLRDKTKALAKTSTHISLDADVHPLDDLEASEMTADKVFLFVLSTTGTGEIPANGTDFYEMCEDIIKTGQFEGDRGFKYAIFGNGDTRYNTSFNFAAIKINEQLKQIGGISLTDGPYEADTAVQSPPWSALNKYWALVQEKIS